MRKSKGRKTETKDREDRNGDVDGKNSNDEEKDSETPSNRVDDSNNESQEKEETNEDAKEDSSQEEVEEETKTKEDEDSGDKISPKKGKRKRSSNKSPKPPKKSKKSTTKAKDDKIEETENGVSDHSGGSDAEYEVEKIIKYKSERNGKKKYLVRWKGYASADDTWETESNLNCQSLIDEFLSNQPETNDADEQSGNGNGSPNNSPSKKKENKRAPKRKSRGKQSEDEEDDEDDEPLSKKSPRKKAGKRKPVGKGSKKAKAADSEEGSGAEDEPEPKKKIGRGRPRKSKKVKENDDDDDDDNETTEEFEVEKIIDVYFKKNGEKEFLVRWKGYSSKDDTWEPEDHLQCQDLIATYLSKCEKARETNQRETRVDRKKTDRYVVNAQDPGRKLSARHRGKPRKTYFEDE